MVLPRNIQDEFVFSKDTLFILDMIEWQTILFTYFYLKMKCQSKKPMKSRYRNPSNRCIFIPGSDRPNYDRIYLKMIVLNHDSWD